MAGIYVSVQEDRCVSNRAKAGFPDDIYMPAILSSCDRLNDFLCIWQVNLDGGMLTKWFKMDIMKRCYMNSIMQIPGVEKTKEYTRRLWIIK